MTNEEELTMLEDQLYALAFAMESINVALAYMQTFEEELVPEVLEAKNTHWPVLLEMQKDIVRMKQEFRTQTT